MDESQAVRHAAALLAQRALLQSPCRSQRADSQYASCTGDSMHQLTGTQHHKYTAAAAWATTMRQQLDTAGGQTQVQRAQLTPFRTTEAAPSSSHKLLDTRQPVLSRSIGCKPNSVHQHCIPITNDQQPMSVWLSFKEAQRCNADVCILQPSFLVGCGHGRHHAAAAAGVAALGIAMYQPDDCRMGNSTGEDGHLTDAVPEQPAASISINTYSSSGCAEIVVQTSSERLVSSKTRNDKNFAHTGSDMDVEIVSSKDAPAISSLDSDTSATSSHTASSYDTSSDGVNSHSSRPRGTTQSIIDLTRGRSSMTSSEYASNSRDSIGCTNVSSSDNSSMYSTTEEPTADNHTKDPDFQLDDDAVESDAGNSWRPHSVGYSGPEISLSSVSLPSDSRVDVRDDAEGMEVEQGAQQCYGRLKVLVLEVFSGSAPAARECCSINSNPNSSLYIIGYLAVEHKQQCAAATPTADDMGVASQFHKVLCGDVTQASVQQQAQQFVTAVLATADVDIIVVFAGPDCRTFSAAVTQPNQLNTAAVSRFAQKVLKRWQQKGDPMVQAFLVHFWDWTGDTACANNKKAFLFMENPHSNNKLGLRTRPYMRARCNDDSDIRGQAEKLRITLHNWCRYGPENPWKLTNVFTNCTMMPKKRTCNCRSTVPGFTGSHDTTTADKRNAAEKAVWPKGFATWCLQCAEKEVRQSLISH